MDDLRDTSRQLIPNLGEGFKQFMTSRVIRGIKIFLQSTWSYKNIQKRCFVSKFPEFLQNSPKIGLKFSWFWDKNAEVMAFFTIPYRSYTVWNMLDHAIWFKSLRSLRVVYNNRGQLKNTDISGALYLLKFSMGIRGGSYYKTQVKWKRFITCSDMHENPIIKHSISLRKYLRVFANPIIKHNKGSKILL